MEERLFKVVGCDALGRVVGVDDEEMTLVFRKRGRVSAAFVYHDVSEVLAIERR